MTDEKSLQRALEDAATTYRIPQAEPDYESMWRRIEASTFDAPRRASWVSARRWIPLAAALAVGVGLGRWSAAPTPGIPEGAGDVPIPVESVSGEPLTGVASDYLEQTTGFFLTLASEVRAGRSLDASAPRARDLLSTTRLLLDSPGTDPSLRTLLEDLELVLAQLVRLPAEETIPGDPGRHLIAEAMDQRDVLPRLQVFLADARYRPLP
jgi:hypothetical protein